jgi:hypothetical protein
VVRCIVIFSLKENFYSGLFKENGYSKSQNWLLGCPYFFAQIEKLIFSHATNILAMFIASILGIIRRLITKGESLAREKYIS